MRYSSSQPLVVQQPTRPGQTNKQFVSAVLAALGETPPLCSLLLVGGNDWRALAIRQAQAALRFDRRPSYWSHAALLLRLDAENPGKSSGFEVSFDPAQPQLHVPERNGVTPFQLQRYFDAGQYPNLGIASFSLPAGATQSARDALADAVTHPNRDVTHYPLWDRLGSWAAYSYAPHAVKNPLLAGLGVPSAMWCEMALQAIGVAATLSATDNNTCPELLWATLKHWHDHLPAPLTCNAWQIVRDRAGTQAEALSDELPL